MYHNLLGFSKVIARVAVERHLAHLRDGDELFGHDLGGIEQVEPEAKLILLVHDLDTELQHTISITTEHTGGHESTYLPLGKPTRLNALKQILAHEIAILARHLLCLFPDHARLAGQRLPVELDQLGLALVGDKAEGMHTESIHMAERPGDTVAGHGPEQRMHGARLAREEVPGGVVRRGSLRDLIVSARLDGVNQIREKDGVLDEEDGDIVSHQVEVSFVGIEAGREAVDIASEIGTAAAASDGGEAQEDGGLFALFAEERSCRDVGVVPVRRKDTVGAGSAGVDGAFWDLNPTSVWECPSITIKRQATYPLMVESLDLLAEDKILQQGRTPITDLKAVLVGNGSPGVGGHEAIAVVQVVLRQEFLGISGGATARGVARRHVGTLGIGHGEKANEA